MGGNGRCSTSRPTGLLDLAVGERRLMGIIDPRDIDPGICRGGSQAMGDELLPDPVGLEIALTIAQARPVITPSDFDPTRHAHSPRRALLPHGLFYQQTLGLHTDNSPFL